MKIYSKFKDYYDHATGFFSDKDRVWERRSVEKTIKAKHQPYQSEYSNTLEDLLSRAFYERPRIRIVTGKGRSYYSNCADYTFILGLCGKLYICIAFTVQRFNSWKHIASYTDIDKYLKQRELHKSESKLVTTSFTHASFTKKGFEQWYKVFHEHPNLENIFIELGTPVFIIKPGDENLVLNPCLSDLKLQSAFDPYTTYQEIDMFLGNQLATTENAELDRSQELIRDSKGFDDWSFKQKGPKKRKRK